MERSVRVCATTPDSLTRLEARVGIEPTHKGFADLSLTTWVPRLIRLEITNRSVIVTVRCSRHQLAES
jgi:hypothetical protein